jgi:hypothetical protein
MLGAMFGSLVAALVIAAAPSVAGADTQSGWGYIEICKTFTAGSPSYQGTFNYKIVDSDDVTKNVSINAVEGGPQICTEPISVHSGTAKVYEQLAPWFSVASIAEQPGNPAGEVTTDDTDGTDGVAYVQVLPSASEYDDSNTATVDYTNDPVTGVVEVCKQAAANSSALTGSYTFDITSTDAGINTYDTKTGAYDLPYTTTATATISAGGLGCSGPITVPAGTIQTVEPGTTYVTDITATALDGTYHSQTDDELIQPWPQYGTGTANEWVQAGDTTDQTIVTYTDALSTVKLCKQWDPGWGDQEALADENPSTVFPFTMTWDTSFPAGPNTGATSAGLEAGQCEIIGTVRTGSEVKIVEGITPGTKVESIDVNPGTDSEGTPLIVPGSESLPNGTVKVIAGPGETDVTYTDEPADPGTLKICVAPTANPTAGTVAFLVNGKTIDVNLSATGVQCTLDNETTFAYDAPVTIVGQPLTAPDAFSGSPVAVPASLEVYECGVLTPTNQSTIVSSTASSATVVLSEGIVTEVTFTVDPPTTAIDPPVTVSQPVVSTGPITVAPVVTPVVTDTGSTTLPTTSNPITTTVKVAISAKVRKLEKQLTTTKAQIKTLEHKLTLRNLSKSLRKADQRELAILRKLESKLARELKI